MDLDLMLNIVLLGIMGIFMGAINTLAGGASLITLPVLIFLGLDGPTANGTNRLSIVSQSLFAIQGYRSKGVSTYPYHLYLALAALMGAIPGAILAVNIDAAIFNKVLAIVMLVVIATLVYNPFKQGANIVELLSPKRLGLSVTIVFLIGLYIGFIQAGAGIMAIMAMVVVHRFSLVKANYIKIWVTLAANGIAMLIFISKGMVYWPFAVSLSIGSAFGGWLSSRISIEKGDRIIRPVLIIMTLLMALKLLGISM